MKTCGKCKEIKPLDDFYNNSSRKSSQCKECVKKRSKLWYWENREAAIEYSKKWHLNNPERAAETSKLWAKNNKERLLSRIKKWQKENPEKVALYQINSRHKHREEINKRSIAWALNNPEKRKQQSSKYALKNRPQSLANARRRQIKKLHAVAAWGNKFYIDEIYKLASLRTKVFGFKWEVDHIVPLQSKLVCGLHVEHNLQVIPRTENRKKSNHFWPNMPEGQVEIGQ